jgi:hypothetical protein
MMKIKKPYANERAKEDLVKQMEEVDKLCDGGAHPPTCIRALLKCMSLFMEYQITKED